MGGDAGRLNGKNTVKAALTPKRRRRVVETDQFNAMIVRVIRAAGRRVAAGDVESLGELVALSAEVDAAIMTAVGGLRAVGYSWTEIANRIGVTKQAAQQRFGGGAVGEQS